jgi:3-deoxy-D-manno-octulosonic-acid transferase
MVLYDIGLFFFRLWLSIAALFDRKIRDGIEGRKNLFAKVKAHYDDISSPRKRILIHVSSYGELEQAKPVIEALKSTVSDVHIHLTFFSPSGYINTAGKYELPDIISYLPFDTRQNVARFLDIVQADLVLFARYDVWHNFARELKRRDIASILFSATFSDTVTKRFPPFRNIQKQTYNALTKIFCITSRDHDAFIDYGIPTNKVDVGGDTRYDQVLRRKSALPQRLPEVSASLHERLTQEGVFTLVAGSTWHADEELIMKAWKDLSNKAPNIYLIIAPHEVTERHLAMLENNFTPTSRFSFYNGAKTILVDSVGKLFGLYRYASVAYVGGGFGAGVHNVLEPAVWGAPIIIGPEHHRSQEVTSLIKNGGAFEINDANTFASILKKLFENSAMRQQSGAISKAFVEQQNGACELIMRDVNELLNLRTPS